MALHSIYRICMFCTLAFLGLALIGAFRLETIDRALNSPVLANTGFAARIVAGAAGALLAIAVSVFWLGMMLECLVSKKLRTPPKAAWLLLMAATNVIGALIYYFAQYQKRRIQTAET